MSNWVGPGARGRRPGGPLSRRWLLATLSLLAGLLSPTLARAEAEPLARVVIVRAGPDASAVVTALREALTVDLRDRGFTLREPPQPSEEYSPVGEIDEALQAYANLHPGEARDRLEAIIARADETGGLGLGRQDLLRALLYLALSALALTEEAVADAALDRALAVEPDLELDPALYSPALRERLSERRTRQGEVAPVSLVVEGAPEGAALMIDGALEPPGTTTVELPPGAHLVRVTAPGRVSDGRRVTLGAEGVHLAVALPVDPATLARGALAPGRGGLAIDEAARALGAPPIIVDITRGSGAIEIRALDASTGRRGRVTGGEDTELGALVSALVASLIESSTPPPPPVRDPRRRRLAWALGGSAAAVVVLSVVLGVVLAAPWEPASPETWQGQVRWDP